MFDETGDPKKSNRKRLFGLLAFLGLVMTVVELIRFLGTRSPIHAGMACIWLIVGVLWGYRFRHFGESRVNPDVKAPK